jgi:hypothetical protein
MATRTRSKVDYGFTGTHTHVRNHNLSSQLAPVTVRLFQSNDSMTDVVTENFTEKLKAGLVINNACSRTKTTVSYSGGGSYFGSYKSDPSKTNVVSGSGSITGFWLAYWSCPSLTTTLPPIGDEIRQAQIKALAAIDKAPYAMAEDVATIRQTLDFLKRPFGSIWDLSKRFKKDLRAFDSNYKRGKRRKSYESHVANVWLEYRFAFQPLVRTGVNVISSLTDQGRYRSRFQTSHGSVESSNKASGNYNGSGYVYGRTVEMTRKVRAVTQYTSQTPLDDWRTKYGLRNKDIPELLWDLFPYSFMIDRVIDIGGSVRGLTNLLDSGIKILGGTVSTHSITKSTRSVLSQTHASWNVTISPDVRTDLTDQYSRSVWTPQVLDLIPTVLPADLVKDATSIADLASLIIKNLK